MIAPDAIIISAFILFTASLLNCFRGQQRVVAWMSAVVTLLVAGWVWS